MKAQLILLDTPIIVSDEEIKNVKPYLGKWHLEKGIINKFPDYLTDLSECKLIIAGLPNLPSIDFNGLEEKFSIIDVEKLAETHALSHVGKKTDEFIFIKIAFQYGFNAAQSLNDKKYSLEDMINAYRKGEQVRYSKIGEAVLEKEFIQSLSQPKVFDVEIEMKRERLYTNDGLDYEGDLKPKITNNQIKIINVCM